VDPYLAQSIVGCIFLSTPFRGTLAQHTLALVADVAGRIGVGLRSSLVQLLQPDSVVLAELSEQFLLLANETSIGLVCINKQQKSTLMHILNKARLESKQKLSVGRLFRILALPPT
jgi:hypothetical protein